MLDRLPEMQIQFFFHVVETKLWFTNDNMEERQLHEKKYQITCCSGLINCIWKYFATKYKKEYNFEDHSEVFDTVLDNNTSN